MTVIGLDLGRRTGLAVLGRNHLYFDTWALKSGSPARLQDFVDRLVMEIATQQPDLVVYEKVQFIVSLAQISLHAQLAGLTEMTCAGKVECFGLPTGTLKLYATGDGQADKEEMIEAAQDWLGTREQLTSDEADAIHLARWGMDNG